MPRIQRPLRTPLLAPLTRPFRDRSGIIVLGPLIVFVCLLIIMVVAGKVLYPAPRGLYISEARPQLLFALSESEVVSEGQVVRRLQPGDSVWVVRLDNGSAAVFRDRSGRELVGITRGLLGDAPRARGAPGGT